MRDRGDLGRVGGLDEAGHREVRGMDPEDSLRPALGEWRRIVLGAGPVRGADFDQLRPRPPDDVGDPDAAADLDELATRDDDPAPAGQGAGEGEGRGVVVRDEGVLRAGQADQVFLGEPEPGAAPSGRAIELEEHGGRRSADGRVGVAGPRGAPEVRVDDHPGGVDHRHDGGCGERVEPGDDARAQFLDGPRSLAPRQPVAFVGDDGPSHLDQDVVIAPDHRPVVDRVDHALDARRARAAACATAGRSRRVSCHRGTGRRWRARTGPAADGRRPPRRSRPDRRRPHLLRRFVVAGAHGSRTHHTAPSAASPVLKTGGPTGTQPLPWQDGRPNGCRDRRRGPEAASCDR